MCKPYRAKTKTKGKVERFDRFLKQSFVVPPAATLKQSSLKLDVEAANSHTCRWLAAVVNARVHATTKEKPSVRLPIEQAALLPLPVLTTTVAAAPTRLKRVWPSESLQHPLSVYDALREVGA